MAVLIPRVRTINVRVSEDEFLAIERFCAASGARSVSDLVRTTMHNLVTGSNQKNPLASSLDNYSMHVKDLEQKVAMLATELALFKAGMKPHSVDVTDDSNETSESNEAPERQPLNDVDDVDGASHSVAVAQPPSETTSRWRGGG
jgi:hypothetical protein